MKIDVTKFTVLENLRLFADVLEHLRSIKVTRSLNNPTGDYAEWLSQRAFNLKLAGISEKGFDASSTIDGTRYQIKARRSKKPGNSLPLGVIRGIDENLFDFLLVVVFGVDFSVEYAYKIPHKIVKSNAKYSEHVRGVILSLNSTLRSDPEVEDVSNQYRSHS